MAAPGIVALGWDNSCSDALHDTLAALGSYTMVYYTTSSVELSSAWARETLPEYLAEGQSVSREWIVFEESCGSWM